MGNLAKCLIFGLISGFFAEYIIGLFYVSQFLPTLSVFLNFIGAFIMSFFGLIGGLIYYFIRKKIKLKYSEFFKGLIYGFIFFLLLGMINFENFSSINSFLKILIESFLFGLIFGSLMKKFGFQE